MEVCRIEDNITTTHEIQYPGQRVMHRVNSYRDNKTTAPSNKATVYGDSEAETLLIAEAA